MPRINPKDAFDPHNAKDEEWATFEKSVRYVAQDPHLDVGKLFNIQERFDSSDSMNVATEATSYLLAQRVQEIRMWVKKNISLQNIGDLFKDWIESLPNSNIDNILNFHDLGSPDAEQKTIIPLDDLSSHG